VGRGLRAEGCVGEPKKASSKVQDGKVRKRKNMGVAKGNITESKASRTYEGTQ
jgi:hypothetical protein